MTRQPDDPSAPTTPSVAHGASLPERLVDGIATRTARREVHRRNVLRAFLVGVAVIGSALSVSPLRWILRPVSAYATVCGSGASCGAGWTAFCCTINDGANTCPPGSFVAGWWKIDDSPFCQGEPRYIIDCNRSPGSSCTCECASGTCDERRVCCNRFRYGQCNTQIGGVTEVVCRVVLCTTPWTWDPACGRTVLTDNRTVTHNAPCLPGADATPIDLRYQDLGLVGSVLGAPVGDERRGPRDGAWRRFEHGVIAHHPASGARLLRDDLADAYVAADGPDGPLGYPVSDQRSLGDGERARFEGGDIYRIDGVTTAVFGPAATRYRELGGPTGALGAPTVGTRAAGDGHGTVTWFAAGAIWASPRVGGQEVFGAFARRYDDLGGPAASGLGYPLRARTDDHPFEDGVLVSVGGQVHVLRGAIARRYLDEGGADGGWGPPVADQQRTGDTEVADFARVRVFAGPGTPAVALGDPVLGAYRDEGGPSGWLGRPTTDSFTARSGFARAAFQHGALEVDPATGRTHTSAPRGTRSPGELTP